MDFSQMEMGPKLSACSERERLFVWYFLTTADGNATEAARQAGYSDPGPQSAAVRVRGHELLHRPRVIEAIEEVGRKEFRALLVPAIAAMKKILQKPDHPDHARTVQSLLSRLGFGETSGLSVTVSGEVTLNHTDAAVDDLRKLRALGVPREKLEEIFGHSGLGRYEKMLDEADRKAGRLIEGRVEHGR